MKDKIHILSDKPLKAASSPVTTVNDWADFWRDTIGINVIPANTKKKVTDTKWSSWQNKPIPEEQHNKWKSQNAFSNGMAIIPGKVWHNQEKKSLYFTSIDADKLQAIEELCTRDGKTISLHEMSKKFLIEEHLDSPEKAHIYFYSPIPFAKKSADAILGLEVKGLGEHGIVYCSPSIHKDGQPYEIIGTKDPIILTADQAKEFMQHIDSICKSRNVEYLEKHYRNLLDSDSKIYQGSRHDSLLSIANSIIFRSQATQEDGKTIEKLKSTFVDINNKRCVPPLAASEINTIWKDSVAHYTRIKKQAEKASEKLEEQEQSYADILVQLALANTVSFFKDQYGTAFALVDIRSEHGENRNEVIRLESNKFKRYLSRLFYDNQNERVINSEAINNAVQLLQAKTEHEGRTITLSLRIACVRNGDDITFHYDLTNPKWQYIKITKQNWVMVDNSDSSILFVRYNQTEQVMPDRNYKPDVFDKFLALTNVKGEQNVLLLKTYIVSLFIPEIPHAMLLLHGEKGSAKSTLQLLIKLLVDPAKPSLLTIHNDRAEFVQQLNHNHIAFYDNVKKVPYWLSDEACKAVTGIGQTKRKLYTDDDDIVYEYMRCLGFNGLNISLTEPDTLDRSILIELNRIAKENRRVESEIIAEFMELRPKLLAYIFDVLVTTLQIKSNLKLGDLPRMADFALWGEAVARAMDYKELEFINTYYENIGRQNIEAIEAHPLGQAIAKYFEIDGNDLGDSDQGTKVLEGAPIEVLELLEVFAQQNKINIDHKLWPKSPNVLTRRLNQIRSNLLEGLGIDVTISRITTTSSKNQKNKINTSHIKIWKMSPMSPIPPAEQKHEGNLTQSIGDISNTGDIIPPVNEIPPVRNDSDHAQKPNTGDTGDTGGIFLTSNGDQTAIENLIIQKMPSEPRFDCYYCDSYRSDIKADYERHVVLKHPRKQAYPSRAELEKLGIRGKGKEWEI